MLYIMIYFKSWGNNILLIFVNSRHLWKYVIIIVFKVRYTCSNTICYITNIYNCYTEVISSADSFLQNICLLYICKHNDYNDIVIFTVNYNHNCVRITLQCYWKGKFYGNILLSSFFIKTQTINLWLILKVGVEC